MMRLFAQSPATAHDNANREKVITNLLEMVGSDSVALTLPLVSSSIRAEISKPCYAELRNAAMTRVLIYRHTIKAAGIFSYATADSFKYIHLSGGFTNTTYKVEFPAVGAYISRLPGEGSELYIDRAAEFYNASIATELKLNPKIVYSDGVKGKQLTVCLNSPKTLTPELLQAHPECLIIVARMQKRLHNSPKRFANEANIFDRNEDFQKLIAEKKVDWPDEYKPIDEMSQKIKTLIKRFNLPSVPCHNDPFYNNFLLSENSIYLIDWEYSGNHDAIWDLAYFAKLAGLSASQIQIYLSTYFGSLEFKSTHFLEYQRFMVYQLIVDDFVYLWSYAQIANKNTSVSNDEFMKWAEGAVAGASVTLKDPEFIAAVEVLEKECRMKYSM